MAVLSHGKGFSAHSAPRSSRVAPFSKSQPLKVTLGQISTRSADVITGLQIRTARSLLGWNRRCLARACRLRVETLARAESVDGEPPITIAHARVICAVLERAGVDFHTRGPTGVTLRTVPAASLNGREHQPSKLRGAGSSLAAVASPNETKKKRPGGRWVMKKMAGW